MPIVTVFGFLALPDRHIFLEPIVTKIARDMIDLQWCSSVQGSDEYVE